MERSFKGMGLKYLPHRRHGRASPLDYQAGLEDLSAIEKRDYDFICCSHVIEHTPNVMLALKNVYEHLSGGGIFVMAVPHMNYTFDCLRSLTDLQHIIMDYKNFSRERNMIHIVDYLENVKIRHFGCTEDITKYCYDYLAGYLSMDIHYHTFTEESMTHIINWFNENIYRWSSSEIFCRLEGAIICAQPVLGEIFFWRTGSTNYLWAICLLLAFGIPLRYYIGNESIDLIGMSAIRCILLTIAGFFAGFTNENTVIVFLVLYIGTIVFDRISRRRTPIWIFLSGTSFFCGAMYMYVAPSTKVRRQIYDQMYGITEVSFQDYYMRALKVIHQFFYDNRILVLLTGILVFLHYMHILSDKNITLPDRKKKLIYSAENLMLLLLTSISCGVLILNPYIETRAFLLPDFFMMVCVLYYFEQLYLFIKKKAVLTGTLTAILAGSLVIEVAHIYHTYNNYYNYVQLRCQAIAEQNDEDTFIWGAYKGEDYSRVLTTREDYLMNENTRLSYYFGKKIRPLRNYIWGFSIDESFEKVHIEGGLDTFWYNREADSVELSGWAVKKEDDAENNSYYVYLDSGQQRFYFKTNRISRKDIADAYGNNIYLNSGFCYTIESVSEVVGDTELENVRAGFCVVDEKNGWFGEQEEGKIYEVVDHSPLF